MSSSLDQITLTGAFTAFEVSTASATKSCCPRRPKPPPSIIVLTLTASSGKPVMRAPVARVAVWFCVPTQISQSFFLTCAVQFIGSMADIDLLPLAVDDDGDHESL